MKLLIIIYLITDNLFIKLCHYFDRHAKRDTDSKIGFDTGYKNV